MGHLEPLVGDVHEALVVSSLVEAEAKILGGRDKGELVWGGGREGALVEED